MKKTLWLHNIRSVHNVGSMFRTADAVGIEHIYLSGYTPLPVDRFGRAREDMAKVAIGAEKKISWSHIPEPVNYFSRKKSGDIYLCGIEQDKRSTDIFKFLPSDKKELVLVMGEEVLGMEKWQRDLCDSLLEIPMNGLKESLNVSVAFGVAAYQVFR